MSKQTKPAGGCRFCDGRKGLAILPVRYAVARRGLGNNAPELSGAFDATHDAGGDAAKLALPDSGNEKATGLSGQPLPEHGGHYTLRTLREGFLYVHDEHLKEWKGYKITGQDYLYPFERGENPPSGAITDVKISCSREGCESIHHLARYVFVKDAENATKIRMVFSDVLWTDDVWKQYDEEGFRAKHMRTFDVAAWLGKDKVDHADDLSKARDHVAEFCAHPDKLEKATRQYVKRYLPKGWTINDLKLRVKAQRDDISTKQDDLLLQTVPSLAKQLASSYATPLLPATCRDYAAWTATSRPLNWLSADDVATMQDSVRVAGSLRPAMLALNDPAGVAMDLNGMVIQQIGEITADPTYFWKMRTATSIDTLHMAVVSSAIEKQRRDREQAQRDKLYWGTSSPRLVMSTDKPPNGPLSQHPSEAERAKYEAQIAQAGELSPAERDAIRADAWKDYEGFYHAGRLKAFLKNNVDILKDKAQPLSKLLDQPYAQWLDSPLLRDYFRYHFDPANAHHGAAHATLARLIFNQAGGRTVVAKFLDDSLKQKPTDRSQWALRALQGNQDTIIAASQKAVDGGVTDWDAAATDVAGAVDKAAKTTATAKQLAQAVAAYTKETSGIWVARAGKALRGQHVPNGDWMLAVVGALAKTEDPGLQLVSLQGTWTRAQAARTMAHTLEASAGQLNTQLMGSQQARKAFASDRLDQGKRYAFAGLLVTTESSNLFKAMAGKKLQNLKQWQKAEMLQTGMTEDIGMLRHLKGGASLAAGLFAVSTIGASYDALMNAGPDKVWDARINFGTSASTLTGQVGESMADGLRAGGKLMGRYMPGLIESAAKIDGIAGVLELGGKIFGFVGGLVAGVWMMWKGGSELYSGENVALGWVHLISGLALFGSAFLLLSASLTFSVIGAVIALIVAIALFVVDMLKPDHIQRWLNKTHFFGMHEKVHRYNLFASEDDYTPYSSSLEQAKGLRTVVGG